MAVNFNKDSVFNLKPISINDVRPEILEKELLSDSLNTFEKEQFNNTDEKVLFAFKTIRDQLIFTNKRIISIDIQGITGKRKEFATMPYSKIQFFSVQTPAFAEIIADSELWIMFSNGFTANFEFKDSKIDIAKTISEFIL